ncbi:hypothetical protein M4I32_04965 [Microbacterium sp. LRZ72]|uniref:hypothetical protein n=1 Tax=Microbacterium sp. LRZ72 TaxID=2942481 RepID=UPI0029AC5B6B|nr:hypothetical protein [Microbacterium sp. LRZ72]MDX2376148.1 hypothetical protein [Microbacterium sp. LRZ72]
MRAAALEARSLGLRLRDAATGIRAAWFEVEPVATTLAVRSLERRLDALATDTVRVAERAEQLADDLVHAADRYELAELRARWLALPRSAAPSGVGVESERAVIARRVAQLAGRYLGATEADRSTEDLFRALDATGAVADRHSIDHLAYQVLMGGTATLGPLPGALAAGLVAMFRATVLSHTAAVRARGIDPAFAATGRARVDPVRRAPTQAPVGLTQVATRIPGGAAARVRVERYDMPAGRREWVVYVAGTQSFGGGDELFDMDSNLELYGGRGAASSDAVAAALADAGHREGETVHAVGHSQGAMIASMLAASDPDVRTLVGFGSPVLPPASADVLSVDVRHSDDVVAALAGPPVPGPSGAPGSFIAERLADPLPGIRDGWLPAHQMDGYIETAALIDASTDPRARGLSGLWAHLGDAESVTATEYAAQPRPVSPSSSAAAG